MPFVNRTRATFRRAEFGFLGVTVRTTVQTPLLKGFFFKAGDFDFTEGVDRPFLTSWLTVGIVPRFVALASLNFLFLNKKPLARTQGLIHRVLIRLRVFFEPRPAEPPPLRLTRSDAAMRRQVEIMHLRSERCQGACFLSRLGSVK